MLRNLNGKCRSSVSVYLRRDIISLREQLWFDFSGLSLQIALNGKTVMVPRQYIECGDCRYDLAVIRLTAKQYESLDISLPDARTVTARAKTELANLTASVHSYLEGCEENRCPNSTLTALGLISAVQKMKLCLVLGNTTHKTADDLLPGSPVSMLNDDSSLDTVGVATHVIRAYMQMDGNKKQDFTTASPPGIDIVDVPVVSAVRITKAFVNFVSRWLDAQRDRSPCALKLHPRYDCFPSYPKALMNQSMCMCARGWTNERYLATFLRSYALKCLQTRDSCKGQCVSSLFLVILLQLINSNVYNRVNNAFVPISSKEKIRIPFPIIFFFGEFQLDRFQHQGVYVYSVCIAHGHKRFGIL